MLEKMALLCWKTPKYKHILFFILTLVIVCSYGYYFGTFDQSSHIPFLKKTVDSTLYPNDHFFDLRSSHYSYFWLLFIPFYKAGVLEISMFIAYIATTYLTFWALWNLTKTLFKNPLTTFLATIAAAFPHIGFSGFPMFEFSLLNRTAVLPFELVAFRYYLKKNYIVSFLILGLLYNLHALSVHFILAMMGMDILFKIVKKKDYKALTAIPFFLIAALPVLIWKFSQSGIQTGVQWEWFHILNISTFFHLFNFVSIKNPSVDLLTAGGISGFIIFFIARKHIPKHELHETVTHFMYGGIIVLFSQCVATAFLPLSIIIQAQVVRIGTFLTLFVYLYAAHLISVYQRSKKTFLCFLTALFLSFSPLILLVSFLFWKTTRTKIIQMATMLFVIVFMIVLAFFVAFCLYKPGIYIWPEKTAFYRTQMWAKQNTPKNTVFLTPPSKWWLYDVEWRVISERSTVSTLSELLEAAFDPSYISYWKPRFEEVAPGALQKFQGSIFSNFLITNEAYNSLSKNEILRIAKKYHASYFVAEQKKMYDFPVVYSNEEYIIYSVRQ